jgi:hypothetical protein
MTNENDDTAGARAANVSTFMPLGRVPYQGPRPRELAPADIERFRRWLAAELRLSMRAVIDVVEWVAFDSRETPHTTMIAVRDGHREFAFSVAKELREIRALDLPRTARLYGSTSDQLSRSSINMPTSSISLGAGASKPKFGGGISPRSMRT